MTQPTGPGFILPNQGDNQQQPYPAYPPQPAYPMPTGNQAHPGYPPQPGYPTQPAYNPSHGPNFQHQPFPAPIQNQPGFGQQPVSNWYADADFRNYLMGATSFVVKQKKELLEAISGWETGNKYSVKDQAGNKIFFVGEDTDCCNRQFFGRFRSFHLAVKDSRGVDVLNIDREHCQACNICCGFLCPDYVVVRSARGELLGSVVQEFSLFYPRFKLKDSTGRTVLKIEGPLCPLQCFRGCGPVVFRVTDKNGAHVGTISKEWGGLVREFLTDADTFGITFPRDLEPSMKAVCLSALFLIDFEYFEATGPRD